MSDYVISCESTVDMDTKWLAERDVKAAYFHFYLGKDEYLDDFGQSVSPKEVYRRMLAGEISRTSQVNADEYIELARPILAAGKDIRHMCLSSGISGTYKSACVAAQELREEFPERKIYVVDSMNATVSFGLLVDKACDLRDQGMDIDAAHEWIEANKLRIQAWFFTSDLTFLIRGGRVSKAAGIIGSVLNICPLLEVNRTGSLSTREKIRTKKKVIQRAAEKFTELSIDPAAYQEKIFLSQAECPEDAEMLRDLLIEKYPNLQGKISIYPFGPTIGCHTGPGTVLLAFWGKEREN